MKLAVVGLDSADWTRLDPWLPHLPNLAAIRKEGVTGDLESCHPPVTIPAWKCYSTGKNPGKLGVFWFAYPDFQTRRLTLTETGGLAGNVWDYLANSLVVNVPGTFPPRPIDGILVAGFPCPDGEPFASPSWVQPQLGDYRVNPTIPPGEEGFPEEAGRLMQSRFDLFLRLARKHDFGQVTIFHIDELHHLYGSEALVLEAWKAIDRGIGRVMEVADNVVLVSDHGSGPMKYFVNIVPALVEHGVFRVRKSPIARWSRLAQRVERTTPSRLRETAGQLFPPKLRDAVRSRINPVGDWLPSAPEQFRLRVNWGSPIVPLSQGLLYANPRPGGIVSKEAVLEAVDRVPGVQRVWDRGELYTGTQTVHAPAFWIETEPGVEIVARFDDSWETRKPVKGEGWIHNHRQEGLFGFWGQDVQPLDLPVASIYDMCPTLLSFFGVPAPPGLDGRALPVAGS